MKKLLNTLYITTPESYISKDGMNVVVSVKQEEKFRIPFINIDSIVTLGYMGASPGVMKLCCDNGISLTFLSPHGKFISRLQGETKETYCCVKNNISYQKMNCGRCMWHD